METTKTKVARLYQQIEALLHAKLNAAENANYTLFSQISRDIRHIEAEISELTYKLKKDAETTKRSSERKSSELFYTR